MQFGRVAVVEPCDNYSLNVELHALKGTRLNVVFQKGKIFTLYTQDYKMNKKKKKKSEERIVKDYL